MRTRSTAWSRAAGLCYLAVIAGGLFAQVVVRGSLIVPGDPVATVEAITANQRLWRWGLVVHLLYLLPGLAMNVFIPELLRPGQAVLARLALGFGLVSVAIEAMSLLSLAVPSAIAVEGPALAAVDESQRQAAAYLAVRLFTTGFGIALVFFAGFCVLVGALILRSRAMPRAIGGLMIVAGACYLGNTLAAMLAPAVAAGLMPWILLPCLAGELSLALWLVLRGVPAVADRRGLVGSPTA
jgi:hypothetical protein